MSQRPQSWRRRTALVVGTLLVVALAAVSLTRVFAGSVSPPAIGTVDGELAPCPDTDNCVRSTATDPRHAADPIPCPDAETDAIIEVLERELPRAELVAQVGTYAHFEVRSRVFGFVDDLELLVEDDRVQFRSASRIGSDDLGANRERVEEVTAILTGSSACG